jgi:hypothetical protein
MENLEKLKKMEDEFTPEQKVTLLKMRCEVYLLGMSDAEKGVFDKSLYYNTSTYGYGWEDFLVVNYS